MKRIAIVAFVVVPSILVSIVQAQKPSPAAHATVPATLPAGWEQIDQRFVFLTVRLSSAEASLAAVNRAIRLTGYQQAVRKSDADTYIKGNELMDRKGGGPVGWSEFYGRSAEKFFYHPTDPNSTYRTQTLLTQQPPQPSPKPGDIAPSQGIPLSQRPPQFDYIYRANVEAQKRADEAAAALGGKIDKLLQRRRELEAEQSALWCEIAFQAVASQEFSNRPLYRMDLKTTKNDATSVAHLTAGRAARDFVRVVDHLMGEAQQAVEVNPGQTFEQLTAAVATARKILLDQLTQQETLALDLGDPRSTVGKVVAAAKRQEDSARNIMDSYRLAMASDLAGDDQRKDTLRAQLQENLLASAETLFTIDQCVVALIKDWELTPAGTKSTAMTDVMLPVKAPAPSSANTPAVPNLPAVTTPAMESRSIPQGYKLAWADEFDGNELDTTKWSLNGDAAKGVVSDAVTVMDGVLTLTVFTEQGKHFRGELCTRSKFERSLGYYEARIKFQDAPGVESAFWIWTPSMLQADGDINNNGMEIDITEHRATNGSGKDLANVTQQGLHWGGTQAKHKAQGQLTDDLGLGTGFHTYGMEWTDKVCRFFVDGKQTWKHNTMASPQPEHIILGLQVNDSNWTGHIPVSGYGSRATSTTKMVVDYVRYYEPTDNKGR